MLLCNLKKREEKKKGKKRKELCSNVFLKRGSCDGPRRKIAEEKGGMEVRNIPKIESTGICYYLT